MIDQNLPYRFLRGQPLKDSMYFPIWLVPQFLSSVIHLKCLLNLVLALGSRLVWRVQLTLAFTHIRVPVSHVLFFWAVLLLAFNWFFSICRLRLCRLILL